HLARLDAFEFGDVDLEGRIALGGLPGDLQLGADVPGQVVGAVEQIPGERVGEHRAGQPSAGLILVDLEHPRDVGEIDVPALGDHRVQRLLRVVGVLPEDAAAGGRGVVEDLRDVHRLGVRL